MIDYLKSYFSELHSFVLSLITTPKDIKMKKLLFAPLFVAFALTSTTAYGQARNEVRMTRNDDGSHSEISTSKDNLTIHRRTYSKATGGNGEKTLSMTVIYRKDKQHKLRQGMIYDGAGNPLYKVKYGYHRTTGRLVKEHMFDLRVKRTRVQTGPDGKPREVEIPVRMLDHRYDAQGREMKPICICLPAGQTAEELFGKGKSTHLDRL